MISNIFSSLSRMSNDQLLAQVKRLAARERAATASLIAHLAEMDARELHLAEGCASLFVYCTRILHLSEHAAYDRIDVARATRRFPVLCQMLAHGDLTLTAARLLVPTLTAENHRALLDEARHKSRREVEEIVARERPRPAVVGTIRKLPSRAIGAEPAGAIPTEGWALDAPPRPDAERAAGLAAFSATQIAPLAAGEAPAEPAEPACEETAARIAAGTRTQSRPSHRAVVEPLSPGFYRVQFTARAETHTKLRRAQELLRHRVPDGDVAEVVDQALDALLSEIERKRFGLPKKARVKQTTTVADCAGYDDSRAMREGAPGAANATAAADLTATPAPDATATAAADVTATAAPDVTATAAAGAVAARTRGSRHIPAAVRRAVWERDGEQCTFVSESGERCSERGFLEFDHRHAHADGGPATVENLRIRCRAHNQYTADLRFGPPDAPRVCEAPASYAWVPSSVRGTARPRARTSRASRRARRSRLSPGTSDLGHRGRAARRRPLRRRESAGELAAIRAVGTNVSQRIASTAPTRPTGGAIVTA